MDYVDESMSLVTLSPDTFFGTDASSSSSGSRNSGGLLFEASITVAVVSTLVSFITVIGNTFVFYIIYTDKRLLTYTNYYILALSASDIVAGGFTMPLYSVYWILGYWPFSDMLCDVYLYANQAFMHISIIMIVTIAYDRWDALEHPLQHLKRRTLSHAIKLISISYIIPLLIWPYLKGSRNILPGRCYPQYVADSFIFLLFAPIIFFWAPFVIICVLYARIYQIIRHTGILQKPYRLPAAEHIGKTGKSTSVAVVVTKKASEDKNTHDNPAFSKDEEHDGSDKSGRDQPGANSAHSDKFRKENRRANRTLTLILIAMVISSLPWSALAPVYGSCSSCIPLSLYQLNKHLNIIGTVRYGESPSRMKDLIINNIPWYKSPI
ncbi:muscarinic acetylcholine receptor M1-like [Amphiura filiformis]|uniref:muscarinic acetylcholine receptor M1-like n=1 Tax=Amphiura filiformis TaxID=82378 RepID=UPI003B21DF3A